MLSVFSPVRPSEPRNHTNILMLREYMSDAELQEAVQLTANFPELLFTHYCIRNHLSKTYSCNDIRVFGYPYENPGYWFICELNKSVLPHLHIAQGGSKHDRTKFLTGLKMFLDEVRQMTENGSVLISTEKHLIHDLSAIFTQLFEDHEFSKDYESSTVFYMTEEQVHSLNQIELTVPYGYEFSDCKPEQDAPIVNSTGVWPCAVQQTCDRLAYLPSVCVRHGSDLVSFEMTTQFGCMVYQYTAPDHRRKGIGRSVELKLAQQIASAGVVPFKAVDTFNQAIIKSSEESPFWTVWTRNGAPVQLIHQIANLKK